MCCFPADCRIKSSFSFSPNPLSMRFFFTQDLKYRRLSSIIINKFWTIPKKNVSPSSNLLFLWKNLHGYLCPSFCNICWQIMKSWISFMWWIFDCLVGAKILVVSSFSVYLPVLLDDVIKPGPNIDLDKILGHRIIGSIAGLMVESAG